MTSPKISTCVDCSTTIIGDRLRCPACFDQHEATQTPSKLSIGQILFAVLVLAQVAATLVILLVLVGKGCL